MELTSYTSNGLILLVQFLVLTGTTLQIAEGALKSGRIKDEGFTYYANFI
jgi:hypothetical protein